MEIYDYGGEVKVKWVYIDFNIALAKTIVTTKEKTYRIHQTDDNHKCFHCDAIGSQRIYKTIERYYFFFFLTPIKHVTYFSRCRARGCHADKELSREQIEFMRLSLYPPLEN